MPEDLPPGFRDRFSWHPEPDLIALRDPSGRAALERLGTAAWTTALDYLYEEGLRRGMGEPTGYGELRARWYGAAGGPGPAPARATPSGELLDDFRARIAPHLMNAHHPRQFGYFTPPPLAISVAGELLAQVVQQGIDVWHCGPAGAFVEEEVVRWLCDLVGYGPASFGLTTSGGVMANFLGMALARDVHLARLRDLPAPPRGRQLEGVRVYTSDQTHFSVGRALDELGFPIETLRVLPSDERFRLHAGPVAEAIAADRAAGLVPLAIVAVSGATNTGSVDLLGELADLAGREDLWLHVDAAYGGAARLSRRDAGRVPDLERADSVTIDPHKWFFQAYDVGALVVRDGSLLERTFGGRRPEYYRHGQGSAFDSVDEHGDGEGLNFWKLGFEGTRRWRALKLWLSWRHLGTDGLGRLIEMTNDLAAHLALRCADADDFEAVPATPELSVVCFRHLLPGLEGEALDAHQDRLQAALEADGDGWLSTTRLRGATYLRAGIVNHHATEWDVDRLLGALRRLAAGAPAAR
jgi:aromatic-L-amino-acid decarboxylase